MSAPYLLHQAIDQAAERTPDHEAIRFGGRGLTYAALVAQANQLAHVLRAHGVRRGDRVGFYMAKSLKTAVALYGIMKAGAAYVPLDPTAPAARIDFMLRDCGIRHLITEPGRLPVVRDLLGEGADLDLLVGVDPLGDLPVPTRSWDDVATQPTEAPAVPLTELDLSYVLYTSGSTGTPKGVAHTHRSALTFAETAVRTYGFCAEDRLSNHAPLHFDLTTLDFFATARAGATVAMIPEVYTKVPASLSKLMEDERLTVLYVVPLVLVHLLHHGALDQRDLSALRWVLFGGEPFSPKHLRRLLAQWPHARFSNVYGPTETNGVTYHVVPALAEDDDTALPIGALYGNVEALVLGADDQPLSPGEPGELAIRAPSMMRGYWNRPDLNAAAFYRRPTFEDLEDVFYRTGDLVQVDDDGLYHFLGRKDRQIKTRGYRVELDEVEAVLLRHASVQGAAAYAVADSEGVQHIEAAVVLKPGTTTDLDDVRSEAARMLPAYALPEHLDVLDRFPQTSTGKIDRRRLRLDAQARRAVPAAPSPSSV